jgi:hypothetical protein
MASLKESKWKKFWLAFALMFIITLVLSGVSDSKPKGSSMFWTLAWMYMTVDAWTYWGWKAVLPFPTYLITSVIAGIIYGRFGDSAGTFKLIAGGLNILGLIIFFTMIERTKASPTENLNQQKSETFVIGGDNENS